APIVEGHVVLMPDAHFGYGPPVGTAMKTRNSIIPYAVGVDIGCGIIAAKTNLIRNDFRGVEGKVLGAIRDAIPSGVGKGHDKRIDVTVNFIKEHGLPPGLENLNVMSEAMMKRHNIPSMVVNELVEKVHRQFGTLGAGNHFVEICEDTMGQVWFVLHSGSRGVGNVLATAHAKRAQKLCELAQVKLESKEFSYFTKGSPSFDAYIEDMLWGQAYAYASREEMMTQLFRVVKKILAPTIFQLELINCHHNYAEEVEEGVWLTRKGAINAEVGRMGIIPGSMGATTHIVRGKGCVEARNTAPHGAGRVLSRGAAKRELDIESFKGLMVGKTWQDRDAQKLLDEA
ncbi:hypothetical protein LCGC14_3117590, partial [marine sediment metagenome]